MEKDLRQFESKLVGKAIEALNTVRSEWLRDPHVFAVDVGYALEAGVPEIFRYRKQEEEGGGVIRPRDLAKLLEIPISKAYDAIRDGLPDEKKKEKKLRVDAYNKPWIRVHVDRKLDKGLLKRENRLDYSKKTLAVGEDEFKVHVVEALYQPMTSTSDTDIDETAAEVPAGADDEYQKLFGEHSEKFRDMVEHEVKLQLSREVASRRFPSSFVEGEESETRERAEPLTGGVSVGNRHQAGGTLGTIVWDRTDCTPCILSNWHVLGGGPVQIGEGCLQPSMHDGGSPSGDTVARLKRWRVSRHVDAALAELTGNRTYSAGTVLCGPDRKGAVAIAGVCEDLPEELMARKIWKCGRTSGPTQGIIDGVSLSMCLTYPDGSEQIFHDQLHILPWEVLTREEAPKDSPVAGREVSQAGDSGAIWLDDDSTMAIGLQFAGDTTNSAVGDFAIANRMSHVQSELNFSITPVFVHPRVLEGRRREAEMREAIAGLRPTEAIHGTAQELIDVMAEIMESVIERFDEEDVTRAVGRIREAVGPQPRGIPKPPGG